MKKFAQFLFGPEPRTTLAGYATAIAANLLPILKSGSVSPEAMLLGAGIAILGRIAGDGGK